VRSAPASLRSPIRPRPRAIRHFVTALSPRLWVPSPFNPSETLSLQYFTLRLELCKESSMKPGGRDFRWTRPQPPDGGQISDIGSILQRHLPNGSLIAEGRIVPS
jgi:hypothetical protein